MSDGTMKMLNPDGSVSEVKMNEGAMAVKLTETRSIALCPLATGSLALFLSNKEYPDGNAEKVLILQEDTYTRLWQLLTVFVAGAGLKDATPIAPKEAQNVN